MKLLNEQDYSKVLERLKAVPINTLFAKAVANRKAAGRVYADDPGNPSVFLAAHPYGMSLLFGEVRTGDGQFSEWLADYMLNKGKMRERQEWMQVWPEGWSGEIERLLGPDLVKKDTFPQPVDIKSRVMEATRVNFTFDRERFERVFCGFNPEEYGAVRTTREIYEGLQGGVTPKYFWRDAEHFLREGAGFTVAINGEAASTAFAAFVMEGQMEMGIETAEKHRGKGYALYACAALIRYYLERGLEPVWACRLENTASYNLAQKLGFTPTRTIPYYCLPE